MYRKALIGLIISALLTVWIAACGITNSSTSTMPAVHMGDTDFIQHSVTIRKSQELNLIDDVSTAHIITNGSWVNGAAMPAKESGAPTVNQNFVGNDSAPVGPFNTAGTYHLYCTIHQNMNLTVTVR